LRSVDSIIHEYQSNQSLDMQFNKHAVVSPG